MSDFEDELLLVAAPRGDKKRSRNADSHKHGDDEDGAAPVSVPLKKRRQELQTTVDEEDMVDDEDAFSDEYGSDLMGDEEDRERLNAMNELQREEILADRAEARERRQFKLQLKQNKSREPDAARERAPSSRRIKASGGSDAATALKKLTAARDRKELGQRQQTVQEEGSDGAEEDAYSEDDRYRSDDNDVADERETSPQERRGGHHEVVADDDEGGADHQRMEFEQIKSIQLKRSMLERWVNEPFFEKTVKNCLVRFAFGGSDGAGIPRYVMMEVEEVEHDPGSETLKPYKFGPHGATTAKYLKVRVGRDERTMPMNVISNQDITPEEYEEWCRLLGQQTRKSTADVETVKRQLAEAEHYRYKPEDVQRILKEKREKGLAPANLAAEKIRLSILLEEARKNGRADDIAVFEEQLQKVMEGIAAENAAGAKEHYGVNNVNQRNRALNNAATIASKAGAGTQGGAGQGGVDIFSRRVTRPAVYWRTTTEAEQAAAAQAAPSQAAPAADKLKPSLQKLDPLDLIKKLDLNIDISMLDTSTGAAPLARKLLGTRWLESISKHNSTELAQKTVLTFADWKRRAGLM